MGNTSVEGFEASTEQEERFIQAVAECRYGRLELPIRTGIVPFFAGVFTVAAGPVSGMMGFPSLTLSYVVAGLALLLLSAFRYSSNGPRRSPKGSDDEWACYETDGGLKPRLFAGENWVASTRATAPQRRHVRWLMGGLQLVWGMMLSGLPLATVAGVSDTLEDYQFWVALFTTIGTFVMGRGLRDLLFLRPVITWALTDQRLVAMAGEGAARSMWFESLVHKPLVVPRSETRATLGLELRKLESAGMLPMRGLWGVDEMPREEADEWARAIVKFREIERGKGGKSGN